MELKSEYDDAMVYLNLLYRRKAETVESAAERGPADADGRRTTGQGKRNQDKAAGKKCN